MTRYTMGALERAAEELEQYASVPYAAHFALADLEEDGVELSVDGRLGQVEVEAGFLGPSAVVVAAAGQPRFGYGQWRTRVASQSTSFSISVDLSNTSVAPSALQRSRIASVA